MRFKKINVSRQLKKTVATKSIFVPELNTTQKSKFNLILTDKTGQFNLNIQVRDHLGRIKETKTITFISGQPVNLLGRFTKSDLLKSKELQDAINKNILKYPEDEVNILKPKPLIPYKTRIATPYEDRSRTEQETFGGSDAIELIPQTLNQPLVLNVDDRGRNLSLGYIAKIAGSDSVQTYLNSIKTNFNFRIYPYGSTPAEDPNSLYYTYSILDEHGEAILKIPLPPLVTSKTVGITDGASGVSGIELGLYSFRNPFDRAGSGERYIGPSFESLPDGKEVMVIYVLRTDFHRGIRSGVEEIFPVNDLGRSQKFSLVNMIRKEHYVTYNITTTPIAPLVKSTGIGDE